MNSFSYKQLEAEFIIRLSVKRHAGPTTVTTPKVSRYRERHIPRNK